MSHILTSVELSEGPVHCHQPSSSSVRCASPDFHWRPTHCANGKTSWVWHTLGAGICLIVIGVLIPQARCDAQSGIWVMSDFASGKFWLAPPLKSMPLTVRLDAITLGAENPKAGEYSLGTNSMALAYVPGQCVGIRRCPLTVILHDDMQLPRNVIATWSPVADKYGMIILAPWRGGWDLAEESQAHDAVDSAMKWIFTKFAADPQRIALVAHWSSGRAAMALGGYRLDLFSRVVLATTDYLEANVDPHNHTTQFLLTECVENGRPILNRMQALEHDGHPTQAFVGFRGIEGGAENYERDVIGHWLQQSWVTRKPLSARAPAAGTVPVLTVAVIQNMRHFWHRFQSEPESIRTDARWAHQHEVALLVPGAQLSVLMVDMPALARQYPLVAADLQASGLTAEEHDAYRIALASAGIVADAQDSAGPSVLPSDLAREVAGMNPHLSVQPGSVAEQNVQFLIQHTDIIGTPGSGHISGMWLTP